MPRSPSNWSARIAKEFEVPLPADLAAWFDHGIRTRTAYGYGEPVDPESLLDADAATIWGGQMLPDTLPILTNGFADVIAARFGFDGCVREYVEWQHTGSHWSPCGKTLREALLYDAARDCCREGTSSEFVSPEEDHLVFAEWALAHSPKAKLGESFRAFLEEFGPKKTLSQALLSHRIAAAAVLRDIADTAMTSGLDREREKVGGLRFAEKAGVEWEEIKPWLLDMKNMPREILAKLAKSTGKSEERLMARDTATAEKAAACVLKLRKDLTWPFVVLGWITEERGDLKAAAEIYADGLWALDSTADFTQTWMWNPPSSRLKFCAKRLCALRENGIRPSKDKDAVAEAYLASAGGEPSEANGYTPLRTFWLSRAKAHASAGDHRRAYEACYAMGWDDMVTNGMEGILERLVHHAEAAESTGLASLASHHLATMRRKPKERKLDFDFKSIFGR